MRGKDSKFIWAIILIALIFEGIGKAFKKRLILVILLSIGTFAILVWFVPVPIP